MNNQLMLFFETNKSLIGETYHTGGHKYLVCSVARSGFFPPNRPFPHLLIPDDNSILANSIRQNPGDFFTIPFADLKFSPELLKKGLFIQDAFLVKNTDQAKKVSEKEPFPQEITFKVRDQKKKRGENYAPNTYDHELEIEPFSLGIEGLPEISQIRFSFGYNQSLENEPNSLINTKLYNSKFLAESTGKTFTLKVKI
jgi:hypothetical protein